MGNKAGTSVTEELVAIMCNSLVPLALGQNCQQQEGFREREKTLKLETPFTYSPCKRSKMQTKHVKNIVICTVDVINP